MADSEPRKGRARRRGGTFAEPPPPERLVAPKRMLAGIWVAWSFWLVFRPTPFNGDVDLTPEARRAYAILGFAIVFLVAWGLLGRSRWAVTASRALTVALMLGVLPGPAGRPVWVYALDVVFFLAAFVPAFVVIRIGPRPLADPRRTDAFLRAREQRARERRRR